MFPLQLVSQVTRGQKLIINSRLKNIRHIRIDQYLPFISKSYTTPPLYSGQNNPFPRPTTSPSSSSSSSSHLPRLSKTRRFAQFLPPLLIFTSIFAGFVYAKEKGLIGIKQLSPNEVDAILRENEKRIIRPGNGIEFVDVAYLEANDPIEDRETQVKLDDGVLFGVFDGNDPHPLSFFFLTYYY